MFEARSQPARAWLSVGELADVIEGDAIRRQRCLSAWLSPGERVIYDGFEVPKRRREWLAGRVAAKELVRRRHRLSGAGVLRTIEIVAPAEGPHKGKPSYLVDGARGPFDISISHCRDHAVAALATAPGECIGIDLERIEPRDASFEELALSQRERDALNGLSGATRALAVTKRWVLKEALVKALAIGLSVPLVGITVELDPVTPTCRFAMTEREITGDIAARWYRRSELCTALVVIRPVR